MGNFSFEGCVIILEGKGEFCVNLLMELIMKELENIKIRSFEWSNGDKRILL